MHKQSNGSFLVLGRCGKVLLSYAALLCLHVMARLPRAFYTFPRGPGVQVFLRVTNSYSAPQSGWKGWVIRNRLTPVPGQRAVDDSRLRVGGCPALLRQSGKPSQFAGMEHTILAQGGEAADDLVIASVNAEQMLIDVQFQACHSSRPAESSSPTDRGSTDCRLMYAS